LGFGTLLMVSGCHLFSGCQRAPGADVVATVNGKEIMRADLEKLYKANLDQSQQEPSPEQANIVRLKTLEGMIDDEILQQRAAKLNLAASDEDVNSKLTEMKAPFTQEEFDRQLKQRGLTLDDLKRQTRRGLTQTKLINKEIESKINITDAEIGDYYNSHKAEFNLIEPQYHLAQIVVTGAPPQQGAVQPQRRAPNEAEAKKEIQSLLNRIDSGEDFGTLATQFSENANFASNGGDMGFIAESQLKTDTDIYNAVNALKPGQVTQPLPIFDTSGPGHKLMGYAIYKLFGREAAGQRELKDPRVQQSIRQGLRDRKTQLLQTAYYEMLHNDAKIKNYFAEQILKQGAQ
jgi:peptidyl-prolyl cis-trans isomerase SurA